MLFIAFTIYYTPALFVGDKYRDISLVINFRGYGGAGVWYFSPFEIETHKKISLILHSGIAAKTTLKSTADIR